MKCFVFAFAFLLSTGAPVSHAQGPEDEYVQVYKWIAEGDQLATAGQSNPARNKYLQAQTALKKLQASHPIWNERLIVFRLNYLDQKLGTTPAENTAAPSPQAPEKLERPSQERLPTEKEDPDKALKAHVFQLQQANSILETKLREALSAQPAAIDPKELREAEERIKYLEKEKELLRASLEQERSRAKSRRDSAEIEGLKNALAESRRNLAAQKEAAGVLAKEKTILGQRLQVASRNVDAHYATQLENQEMKRQLSILASTKSKDGARTAEPELARARAEIKKQEVLLADLQSSLRKLREEKTALEKSKAELERKLVSTSPDAGGVVSLESERLRSVEKERDDLMRKLNETTRQLYDNKAQTKTVERDQMSNQMSILSARLEVFEAKKVPYTPEELALFKQPQLMAARGDPKAPKKSIRELPRGTGALLTDAERAFVARRYEEAEKKYKEILRLDENNAFTLANLAASQLEQNHLQDAETNLKKALSIDGNDPHALSLLGILKFRQTNYDEALDYLSRAAQIDPQNAETQNYLGITLSQKGQRVAAETALRKAIQLAPAYGGAHHNLAVIYATQDPPFTELARWHYQKALASGHHQNPDLEKLIENAPKPADAR